MAARARRPLVSLLLPCVALLGAWAVHALAEEPAPTTQGLCVSGAVEAARTWTVASLREELSADVKEFEYRQKDGPHKANGIPLRRLLEVSRPRLDPEVKHHDLSLAVVARSSDGYSAAFSFGELDEALGKASVWVALDRDGGPLSEKHGPVELIVVTDGKGSRWVRALQRLEVVDLRAVAQGS